MFNLHKCHVGIVGLGYVGLPLAVEFGKHFDTVGFDIKPERIRELKAGRDSTREASPQELRSASLLKFTTRLQDLKPCGVMVVTVPTPIDEFKRPELTPLIRASESIGKVLKKGDVVVYESTVYPGCTEEICVPILERVSGFKFNRDFFVGYSPERINPGDKEHRLTTIRKITSGSTPAAAKWNFLPFRPGLVGGHCIGVDPYYLTHKATEIGYHPEMILAGRRLNDNMGLHVANEVVRLMTHKRIHVKGARVLILGLTFKENCPDIRNSKVVDVVRELEKYGAVVDVHDPWVDAAEARHEYGIKPVRNLRKGHYDAAIIAVAHREFKAMGPTAVRQLCRRNHALFDIKYVFPAQDVDGRL
jgi:UDP-N-acetyl-D-mannosaminuronate dehydrogenase